MNPKPTSIATHFAGYLGRRSIRSLLLFVLGFMLIPVFLIGFMQAHARLAHDREVVRQNLIDNVALSAEQALHVIDSAQLALVSLSVRDEVRGATPACAQTLAIAQLAMPYTTNIARIDAKGIIVCSAHPILMSPDLSNRPWLTDLSRLGEISFAGPVLERQSKTPVIILGLGLTDQNKTSLGYIVAGINLEKLEAGLQRRKARSGAALSLVGPDGTTIRRPSGIPPTEAVPEIAIGTKATRAGAVATARDAKGQSWTYARTTLVPNRLHVAYSVPDDVLYASTFRHVATDIALPLIALILAGAGLWFGVQLWAISPIVALRGLAKQYSVGRFDAITPKFRYGPTELTELRDELSSMAARASHRDDRLKRVARQKDDLVKELHHRVKNNLQIVISLIGLQSRQTDNAAQKAPLERVHARIMAMALVERLIVETDENPSIDAHLLLEEVCALVRRIHQSESLRVKLSFQSDHAAIPTDMATPLALFAFEAITNAFRHGFGNQTPGHIQITFDLEQDNIARLSVSDTGSGWSETNKYTGTGHQLLKAFSRQLGGQFDMNTHQVDGSRISLSFPLPDQLTLANDGHAPE